MSRVTGGSTRAREKVHRSMAGHSHWKSIKHKKGAADAKRGKVFSKLAKYITVAARHGGGDPTDNLRLRYAIDKARAVSMPKDSIERAVKKGTGELLGEDLAELVYECIGPGGCALVIEALTDNRTRTAGEIRNMLEKKGGSLGKVNSVLWKFERKGILEVSLRDVSEEEAFETTLDAGAENIVLAGENVSVHTKVETFEAVRSALQKFIEQKRQKPDKKWGETEDESPLFQRNELVYTPMNTVRVEGEKAQQLIALVGELEDHEDVQAVYGDFDVPEEFLERE